MTNDVRFIIKRRQRLLDQPLRLGIEGRGRLVEDQDRRVLEQRAGDRQPLPLAAGQPLSALADRRLVAFGLRGNEVMRVGGARRGLDLLRASRRAVP